MKIVRAFHLILSLFYKLNFMKKILFVILLIISISAVNAQVPQGMNYQSVLRDASGATLPNTVVKLRFTIQNSISGTTVYYSEEQRLITNALGLVTAVIGQGTVLTGSFDSINWSAGSAYLKLETDVNATGTYIEAGTTQMMSVPYAQVAKRGGLSFQSFFTGRFTIIARDSIVRMSTDSLVVAEGGQYLITVNTEGYGSESNDVTTGYGDNEIDAYLLSGDVPVATIKLSENLRDYGYTSTVYNLTPRASSVSVVKYLAKGAILKPAIFISNYGSQVLTTPLGFSTWEMNILKVQ